MSRRKKEDNTSRTQIIIAVIGLLGLVATGLITNIEKWWPTAIQNQNRNSNVSQTPEPIPTTQPKDTPTSRKVVAIMDNNLLTYDTSRGREGRTNHDDIADALRELELKIVPFNTNLGWIGDENNYKRLWEAKPDLIIIHASAFSKKTDPDDTDDNFRIFLHNAMPNLPNTKLLVYSRAFKAVTKSEIERYVSAVTNLRQRTSFFKVEHGASGKYFNDRQISSDLRNDVNSALSSP
jgi:hypothetical protein